MPCFPVSSLKSACVHQQTRFKDACAACCCRCAGLWCDVYHHYQAVHSPVDLVGHPAHRSLHMAWLCGLPAAKVRHVVDSVDILGVSWSKHELQQLCCLHEKNTSHERCECYCNSCSIVGPSQGSILCCSCLPAMVHHCDLAVLIHGSVGYTCALLTILRVCRDCMNSRLGAVMTIFVAVAAIQVSRDSALHGALRCAASHVQRWAYSAHLTASDGGGGEGKSPAFGVLRVWGIKLECMACRTLFCPTI